MLNLLLSPEDEPLRALNWYVNNQGYLRRTAPETARGYELIHRRIAGAAKGQIVDHVNGDKLDNRRENLRLCTHGENMRNRHMHKNNSLGVKGIYRHREKFVAKIRVDGRQIYLGYFETLDAASAAYADAAVRLHGDFARA